MSLTPKSPCSAEVGLHGRDREKQDHSFLSRWHSLASTKCIAFWLPTVVWLFQHSQDRGSEKPVPAWGRELARDCIVVLQLHVLGSKTELLPGAPGRVNPTAKQRSP